MKFNSITGGSTSGTMWDGMGNKMSEATDVVIETRPADGVALLELNRPDALNAVNMDVRQKLAASADSLVEDPDIRVIVIAGRGGNFAAGSDVKVFAQTGAGSLLAQRMHRYWESLAHCPKPVIAAVEGYALGGGCELAMHADIIVAARTASFGQPEIKLGLMPGAGGTQRLLRAIGKYKTMLLALTGEMLPATEAEKYGLVSRLSEEGEALEEALKLARMRNFARSRIISPMSWKRCALPRRLRMCSGGRWKRTRRSSSWGRMSIVLQAVSAALPETRLSFFPTGFSPCPSPKTALPA
ncbi:enoyl-CoA hydratase [Brucella pinnipedialis B2/94]|uniref:Enoyl-CoA hydratase/isomerase n=2 Tax=Brucella pinnipedialis TaxID=120576 RepID=A0A0E1WX10_9HYPH|nr:enoyl-CoA hydratase [Brucella pinnipedialis B2/94]EEZ28519.1 enoyl-CoA hydratase/isomerase [Brucella pinnipedialis M292/94/1]